MGFSIEVDLDLEGAAARRSSAARHLSVLEAYILRERGYLPHLAFSYADIASLLGVSRQGAQNIETVALRRLSRASELQGAWLASLEPET